MPELAGTIAPTIVGSKEKVQDAETGVTMIVNHPIASRVTTAVQRAIKYAGLRRKANAEKRVALSTTTTRRARPISARAT